MVSWMAKRRERDDGMVEKMVESAAVVVVGSLSGSLTGSSAGGTESASLASVKVERPFVSLEAARGSGGGRRSQRAWVGCMILGYCMALVWISYTPSSVARRVLKRDELNVLWFMSTEG